jgi:hypothetical protein
MNDTLEAFPTGGCLWSLFRRAAKVGRKIGKKEEG